ncbi:putative nuclease HARBI1 [Episyrphus balteatus]|uniref:putative nuclease HARBI1 n=1 Tax=Episyrphus balteatus TaxID=286459 RepID=UPI002485BAD3|nr:putative nuclease HARBI1 [Episyrphus balteatus]
MEYFVEKYGIPGVIGCIDGTHIALQRPTENEHMFFNRKGYHSLNAMIICDHEYKILAVNSQYGGAAHDSFIWKHSDQRKYLEGQYRSSPSRSAWLLGDSGYPLEPWCITPYRSPGEGSSESTFNEVHSKARCVVERTIGILKGRWRILGYGKRGRYKPEKVARIANVCCALHNICITYNISYSPPSIRDDELDHTDLHHTEEASLLRAAQAIRNNIKNSICN